ncbi:MAG: hypothetical protein DWQ01_05320 [Planctomycetota bacterium]|nr:MAG: hypothetical protein DWQ01_05320 [Planctomycetota bacterium]
MTTTRSFAELGQQHETILEFLACHQEALVEQDLPRALETWQRFRRALLAHAKAEDEVLLPPFEASGEAPLGASAELIYTEHRKMRRLLERTGRRLEGLSRHGRLEARTVVFLIEEERLLKEVIDHHDRRERAGFFPALDRLFTGSERERLWSEVDAIHAAGGLAEA